MPAVTLTSLLEPERLADLAGMRSYARGAAYHSDGRVELGAVGAGRAEAVVRGTMPYDVALWVDMNALRWSCACPVGDDGAFCKHCVAVGLAVVRRKKLSRSKKDRPNGRNGGSGASPVSTQPDGSQSGPLPAPAGQGSPERIEV